MLDWRTVGLALLLLPLSASAVRYVDHHSERDGIRLAVALDAIDDAAPAKPQAGQFVRLRVKAERLADHRPLDNWNLGVWLDSEISPLSGAVPVCSQRVARFLSGNLLNRPLLDLTGYFVLTLDRDGGVSVLDPSVSFAGKSSLLTRVKLDSAGFDWVKTSDDRRLFVALPETREVAMIDLQTFKLLRRVTLGGRPSRLALMPGDRQIWIGQSGPDAGDSWISVLDAHNGDVLASFPAPAGHHEFAFNTRDGRVFVSSRNDGAIQAIDSQSLKVVNSWRAGKLPLSLALTEEGVLWAADAESGRLLRFDPQGRPLDSLQLRPGIGPLRLSPDGTQLFAVNPSEHTVFVIDTRAIRLAHTLTLSGRPYDVMFSKQYAYVRALDTEQVAMLSLNALQQRETPAPKWIAIGARTLADSGDLPIASSMATAVDTNGAFFASPTENTVYHYMEGMNAPDTGIRTYGHTPMATMIVRRGLRPVGSGEYEAVLRLPSAGRQVLALASDNPRVSECVGLRIESDVPASNPAAKAQWLNDTLLTRSVGEELELRIRVPVEAGIRSAAVRMVPTDGGAGDSWPLTADDEHRGEYAARVLLTRSGNFYLHIITEPATTANFATLIVNERP